MLRSHGPVWAAIAGGLVQISLAPGAVLGQDPLENAPIAPQSARTGDVGEKNSPDARSATDTAGPAKSKPEFIVKTPAEWRKILSRTAFAVAREKATEQPFSGKYATGHYRGTFICVCCDAAHVESDLFSAQHKFDSGTGWPSFYQAFNNSAVRTAMDYGGLEPRVEVTCRRCGAHLGHIFDDGPPPTGWRFCINSAAIKLKSTDAEGPARPAANRSSSKAKSKAKGKLAAKTSSKTARSKPSPIPTESDHADSGDPSQGASSPPSS